MGPRIGSGIVYMCSVWNHIHCAFDVDVPERRPAGFHLIYYKESRCLKGFVKQILKSLRREDRLFSLSRLIPSLAKRPL